MFIIVTLYLVQTSLIVFIRSRAQAGRSRKLQSDPLEDPRKHNEGNGVDGEKRTDEQLLRPRLPVMHVTGGGEEGDVNRHKNRESAPPFINPHKSRRLHQEYFQNGGKSSIGNCKGQTVIDSQNFLRGVFRH